ncbi:MAG TPA: ABC transporter substrate-binding protein [Gemmataceae bacterium]|nr:ABC transporter substrate-binding protein [Gemmataceae bacterium]
MRQRPIQPRALWPAALALFSVFWTTAAGRGEDIVIGMSAAFRGPSRGLGTELYRGAMAYFSSVNAAGGVHGRRIVIKAYDDGYDPNRAVDNTMRLLDEDKVFLLFGYVGTPTTTRVLPLLAQRRAESVYLFCPFTGATPLRQPPYGDRVFNLRASYRDETRDLVDHFVTVGRKRIAVFYQIDNYGRSGWCGVRQALAARGLSITAEATYRRGTSFDADMMPQVALLRRAAPDAVICVGAYAACAAFIRDARDQGWDVPIANVSFVGSENLLALLQKAGAARGKDYTHDLVNSQVVPSYNRLALEAVREYRRLMDRYRPQPPASLADPEYQPLPYSFVSFEGFLDAKLLVKLLEDLGPNLRREQIQAAAEHIKNFSLGLDAPVSFTPEHHQGLDRVYCTTVEHGQFVRLTDWTRWKQ